MPTAASGPDNRLILFPYAGDAMGGSVGSSFLLIQELLERNRRVVLAFHGEGAASELARKRGFPSMQLPALGRVPEMERNDGFRLGNYASLGATVGAIRSSGAALVHVNDKRMLRTYTLPALLTRRVLLNHWRSVYKPSLSVDLGLRVARKSVSVSQYSLDLLPPWAQAQAEVVYNPFQVASVPPDSRRRLREQASIPADAAVIGCFGTLHRRKRPSMMFDILDRIEKTRDGRPVHGLVCGGWVEPRDAAFEAGIAAGRHADRLVWTGHVDNAMEWMAACDAIVLPAVDEPLSRVGVEAQSLGIAPIVSSDGGLKEVVEHGVSGFVVDPYEMEGWIGHVRRMIDEPEVRGRMAEASIAAAARLSVAKHVDRISAIHDELLPPTG